MDIVHKMKNKVEVNVNKRLTLKSKVECEELKEMGLFIDVNLTLYEMVKIYIL